VEAKWKADQARNPGQVPSAPVGDEDEDSEEESESDEQVERVILETTRKPEEEEEVKMPETVAPAQPASSSTSTAGQQQPVANKKLSHLIAEHDEGNADEVMDEDNDDELALTLEQKLLASRSLHPTHCLFCSAKSTSIDKNLDHMFSKHSFYVPERQFLADPAGFMLYLAEKLAIGNVCLFCEAEFGTLEAVRGHMKDKRHQKIRYEDDNSRAEYAEWYDFSSSYPDAEERRLKDVARTERREERRLRREAKEEKRRKREEELEGDGGWEEDEGENDEDGEMEVDEVVVVDEAADDSSEVSDDTDESDFEEDDHGISLAPDGLSLRLPSGRTLGHRSLKVYYQQNLRPESEEARDSTSTALTTKLRSVRAKLADPSLSLVPVGGGSGAFGKGQMVMKARNAGEAKWAKKLGSSHLDQRKKEAPRQLVSMRGGNNQKHYRDMLREYYGHRVGSKTKAIQNMSAYATSFLLCSCLQCNDRSNLDRAEPCISPRLPSSFYNLLVLSSHHTVADSCIIDV
jgi:pre-60S factor REI1